jgi:hypothetical protein
VASDELLTLPLDDEERNLLSRGIAEWGGSARCTDEFAQGLGFGGVADLDAERPRLLDAIRENRPLSRQDWRRVLLLTEVAFASDVVGSGVEWETTTGVTDETTVRVLRRVQRKAASHS